MYQKKKKNFVSHTIVYTIRLVFLPIHSMDCLRRRVRSFLSNTKKAAAREDQNGEARLLAQLKRFGRESNPIMIFTLRDILLMTNNFSDTNLVDDSTASLYKGSTLGGCPVVVRKPNSDRYCDTQEWLMNSIVVHSNMNHKNIVKLIGCCLETQLPIPVYNFTFNGTLRDRMHHPKKMSWKNRLRIAIEIADGLNYMHNGAPLPIIHRDIHPQNVILDETGTAKIIDHGFSVPVPLGETFVADIVVGTSGYGDPEYIDTGQVAKKSDVYSFGVSLLHLLTGKHAMFRSSDGKVHKYLVDWFLLNVECGHLLEVVDVCIREEGSSEQFQAFAEIALRCTRGKGERPAMKEVVLELRRIKRL
ncbi:Wall-associated receptor kinase 4 [Acorus calamus]|uniref:Wall-associated receptor kinase 4 n=1 Tax=Acorus calamus TaxID=4465 RepID=A0AAV9BZG6_ACOCL|nr:Wall-associated receptor kinase 4 [Acorus calamus]